VRERASVHHPARALPPLPLSSRSPPPHTQLAGLRDHMRDAVPLGARPGVSGSGDDDGGDGGASPGSPGDDDGGGSEVRGEKRERWMGGRRE